MHSWCAGHFVQRRPQDGLAGCGPLVCLLGCHSVQHGMLRRARRMRRRQLRRWYRWRRQCVSHMGGRRRRQKSWCTRGCEPRATRWKHWWMHSDRWGVSATTCTALGLWLDRMPLETFAQSGIATCEERAVVIPMPAILCRVDEQSLPRGALELQSNCRASSGSAQICAIHEPRALACGTASQAHARTLADCGMRVCQPLNWAGAPPGSW